jgi:hypothetical protein
MRVEVLDKLIKFNDLVGIRALDLPVCRIENLVKFWTQMCSYIRSRERRYGFPGNNTA